ncbi:MAG: hypothetical protein HQ509_00400, partial [Candidatus Marinimicrobia bacterium]|nr:hypothetical protein [Candidatus Neomarinimicrobiota bacterium]
MNYQFNFISLILFISTISSLYVSVIAWKHRQSSSATHLWLLSVSSTIWSFAAAFEVSGTTLQLKMFWTNVSYIGISSAPLLYFLLALSYSPDKKHLTLKNILLLAVFPLMTFIVVL